MMSHKKTQFRVALIGLESLGSMTALPVSAADDVRSAIEAGNKKWEAAASRGDAAEVAALYTADAQLLPSQSDFVRGTQAIGQYWQAVFDSGVKEVSLTTLEVEGCENTAHEVGKLEIRGADGKVLDRGKYVVVWNKEGDAWKLHRDIWTTSVVPAKK